MPWVLRGLRHGVVTTRYPRRPDGYGPAFRGLVDVHPALPGTGEGTGTTTSVAPALASVCPTGAVLEEGRGVRVDRGRCILCGRCVEASPERFGFSPVVETASLSRAGLVVPRQPEDDAALARLRAALHRKVKTLRRSVSVRHLDAGSDGAEEWEIAALGNPVYDVQRLGIFFTASPRHADVLLVTGTGTAGMAGPLRTTFEAMPDPKIVIAAGTDAVSGGLVHPTYVSQPGIASILPVDVWVPGSPPSPFSLLHGILLGIGLLAPSGTAP